MKKLKVNKQKETEEVQNLSYFFTNSKYRPSIVKTSYIRLAHFSIIKKFKKIKK